MQPEPLGQRPYALLLHTRHLNDFPTQYGLIVLGGIGVAILVYKRIWWPPVLWLVLTVATIYSGSPFRKLRRDYQTSIYAISDSLGQIPRCDRLVSIGSGPFPEHGVGWEAGIYASYFAQCRIVGFSPKVPPADKAASAAADSLKDRPRARPTRLQNRAG